MNLRTAVTRAARAMREDARLHAVAISTLTVAFLCLGTALVGISNLASVADAWGRSARMTVFLREGARPNDVEQLRLSIDGLPEVREVRHLTPAMAREEFLRDAEVGAVLTTVSADAFPASLEVELTAGVSGERLAAIAERVGRFNAVEDVETYHGWFERLEGLLTTGRVASVALAVLVMLCVVFVVGSTIRLAITGRKAEIEVLKLCGASDGFVRGPFLVEGAVQGLLSSAIAVGLLLLAFALLRGHVDGALATLAGVRAVFLSPAISFAIVLGGGVLGAAGSAISLRRYLAV